MANNIAIPSTAAFLFLSLLISTATAQNPVLDTDGSPLRPGTNYYILPATADRRGGLTAAVGNNSDPCPLDVQQARTKTDNGTPLTFTSVDPKQVVIQEATDLNIKFISVPASECPKASPVWQLAAEEEGVTGNYYVRIGGVAGNPGSATVNNWFKIEKVDANYKIVSCPTVCGSCKVKCDFIGVYVDGNGRYRLAQGFLLDNPFLVKFKKA